MVYSIFTHGGLAQEWLTQEVKLGKVEKTNAEILLWASLDYDNQGKGLIELSHTGEFDLSSRYQKVADFRDKFNDRIKYRKDSDGMIDSLWIQGVNLFSLECAKRRIKSEFTKEKGFSFSGDGIGVKYELDEKTNKYMVVAGGE
jgi:hypothetical protein